MARLYETAEKARKALPKAIYEMAFSDSDIFQIENDFRTGHFIIVMYSALSKSFCGIY